MEIDAYENVGWLHDGFQDDKLILEFVKVWRVVKKIGK